MQLQIISYIITLIFNASAHATRSSEATKPKVSIYPPAPAGRPRTCQEHGNIATYIEMPIPIVCWRPPVWWQCCLGFYWFVAMVDCAPKEAGPLPQTVSLPCCCCKGCCRTPVVSRRMFTFAPRPRPTVVTGRKLRVRVQHWANRSLRYYLSHSFEFNLLLLAFVLV